MKSYEIVSTGITGASGELHRQGEILTAEQIGDVELHLRRGAIRAVPGAVVSTQPLPAAPPAPALPERSEPERPQSKKGGR